MITTIQLNEEVKNSLRRLKDSEKQTYEDVIVKIISERESEKKRIENLLIDECKEMAEENLRIAKEWEGTLMDGLDRNEKWEN